MNIAIVGNGRMGRTLDAVCARRDDVRVIGHVGRGGCESLDALDGLDAALDFSAPENLPMLLSGAVRRRIPLVIGTTGMSGAQGEAIRRGEPTDTDCVVGKFFLRRDGARPAGAACGAGARP